MAWKRDQKYLRDTDLEKFQLGGKTVKNVGAHNTANVSLDTMEGINQLDVQEIYNTKSGELGILLSRLSSYRSGEEERFLNTLTPLFVVIVQPMADLLYGSTE